MFLKSLDIFGFKSFADRTHIDFTHELCPAIDATNISVRDVAHNNKRMWMDKIYYFITSIRPF